MNIFGEKNKMKLALGSLSWILYPFILFIFFLMISIVLRGVLGSIFFLISIIWLILCGFFLVFFRDPIRKTGEGIVAVADGRIRDINNIIDKEIGECIKISTFMNIYDVHVNRMPLNGVIKKIDHLSGSYIPTYKKESDRNERINIIIDTEIGIVKIIQIAGTLARRIVPYIKKGDKLKKGEKIGIIRLGSRVDIYLPSCKIKTVKININDRLKAGENTIAEIYD
jgi:phosphatidylserine decarboxylase